MLDMLREMIHDLRARVEALEATLAALHQPGPAEDADGGGDTIQPDDPTNEDDNE